MLVLSILLLTGLVCVFFSVGLRLNSLPIVISLMFFSMIYILRPLMLAFGANTISPSFFSKVEVLGSQAILYAFLYLSVALFAVILFHRTLQPVGSILFPAHDPSVYNFIGRAAIVLSILSFAVAFQLFQKFGTYQAVIYASKISKDLEGTFGARQIVAIAAFLSLSAALGQRQVEGRWTRGWFFFCLGVVNLYFFSLWGSRLEVFVMFSAAVFFLFAKGRPLSGKIFLRFGFFGLILLVLATWLYVLRLVQLSGSWEVALSRDIFTTTAISLHMTRFDSLMLVVQDFAGRDDFRNGQDFYNGLIMVIPRFLWEDKPSSLLIGQWFRQYYEPSAVNGWTVGGPGEFLVNFGFFGVLVGGFIYGVMLCVVQSGIKKMGSGTPLAVMMSFVIVLIVIPEGSVIQMLPRIILWVLPVWFLIFMSGVFSQKRKEV